MKRKARWALSWSLFWMGHLCSLPLRWDWTVPVFFRPYQTLMKWSSVVQGETDDGPWIKHGKA